VGCLCPPLAEVSRSDGGGGIYFFYFRNMKADKENQYGYSKNLQPFANKLRKSMTKAEACLWKYALRANTMKGYPFRRERPVLNYIADFMCIPLKLVIEVDGLTHQWEETIIKDQKKDADLKAAGFTVLRFDDNKILTQMPQVIAEIEEIIKEIEYKLQEQKI
jgi:very-short-patch-repair endonuclease